MWCLPSLNCTDVHRGRLYRRWVRRLRWLGAVVFIMPSCCWLSYRHFCWDIEWVGQQVQIVQVGGIVSSCRPNPYENVGSFESESITTICGSGGAKNNYVIISCVLLPDSTVELKITGVLVLGRMSSPDNCFTQNTFESLNSGEIGQNIFNSMLEKCSWSVRNGFREVIRYCRELYFVFIKRDSLWCSRAPS